MRSSLSLHATGVAIVLLGSSVGAFAQAGATAKVCGYLPIADLEALFGAKVSALRGNDGTTMSMCAARFPDPNLTANVVGNPPSTVVTLEQRIAAVKPMLEKRGSQITSDGKVACFTDYIEMGGKKLPTASCFRQDGGYLAFTLQADDAKRISFDTVRRLLDKAAAQRK